jgi:hypothetical protein
MSEIKKQIEKCKSYRTKGPNELHASCGIKDNGEVIVKAPGIGSFNITEINGGLSRQILLNKINALREPLQTATNLGPEYDTIVVKLCKKEKIEAKDSIKRGYAANLLVTIDPIDEDEVYSKDFPFNFAITVKFKSNNHMRRLDVQGFALISRKLEEYIKAELKKENFTGEFNIDYVCIADRDVNLDAQVDATDVDVDNYSPTSEEVMLQDVYDTLKEREKEINK